MLTNIILICFVLITIVSSAHYRGSMITWRVINSTVNPLVIEVYQRHAWNYAWYPCTNAQILAANYMIGSGNLVCVAPCPPNVSTLSSVVVPCTGFNQIEQYVSGESRFTIRVPPNYIFRAVFTSSAWFSLVTGGGTWSVATEINTYKRANGRYNQAPIVTMLPIIRLRQNLTYYVRINVADNDFDRYICIWSNSTQECGGICRSVLNLPASTYLNQTSCVLRFTPATTGFYAMALTILDFENDTSTTPLSRVPIQFIFNVWSSNIACTLPPVYLGDAPADQCIFVEPGQVSIMLLRIRVQCPNATLANIIGVYPTGFTQSSPYTDPYVSTVNNFQITYTANANQVGQNLFCFAGVDSIGNQGDSTCLRFTVQIASQSQNSLYLNNATRFPTGVVPKSQSTWTILYPNGTTFTRPSTSAFVRFKIQSTAEDFLTYDVVKDTTMVDYQIDRLVIRTNVIFTAGEQFYISLDPGVFLPIATCLRDSMGVTDSSFWLFEIASEPNTTLITTTSKTSLTTLTTTARNRTVPTIRTISITEARSTTTQTTVTFPTMTELLATTTNKKNVSSFLISGIVGIVIGALLIIIIASYLISSCLKYIRKNSSDNSQATTEKETSFSETVQQYLLATRANIQTARKSKYCITETTTTMSMSTISTCRTLVDVEC